MIFKAFGIGREIKDVRNDPAGFMVKKLREVINGILTLWGLVLFVPVVVLGIYGLSDLWGGPYEWVRVAFFIYLGLLVFGILIVRALVRFFIRTSQTVAEGVIQVVKEGYAQRTDVHDEQ